jgi:hypothetical protein
MDTGKEVGDYCKEVNLNELNDNSFVRKITESVPAFAGDNELSSFAADFAVGGMNSEYKNLIGRGDFIFYGQCLKMLDYCFGDIVTKNVICQKLFAASIESFEQLITEALAAERQFDENSLRDRLPLDSTPFLYAKRMRVSFGDLPKDHDFRLALQALFLFLLRRRLEVKYASMESFLERYPDLVDRNFVERERLRQTANWMVLAFHVLQPRNNKSFILNLIPKIVEGKNARYITGSGQTRATADRVNLFRLEGDCEKIRRPPRKRKEEDFYLPRAKAPTVVSQGHYDRQIQPSRQLSQHNLQQQQQRLAGLALANMARLGSADIKAKGYGSNESKDDDLAAAMKMASFAPDAAAMMDPLPPGLPAHMYAFHQAYLNHLASGNADMSTWAFALSGSKPDMEANSNSKGGLVNELSAPEGLVSDRVSPVSLSRGFSTGSGLDILLSAAEQVGNWT